ncbi:hypothetical protein [Rubripirellula reticaptiva]|uniref:LarA-like N-terminal domain-containing protein n=1 Tax=Rubripirellula reticaptiva TaxID=2528013 RepID=A0A5C6EMF5_9BACT|nr:hypothetical protein [Rubripirellula reticaptiva]TWU48469.1 hypothetical protein Poly59_53170 [Rubripirellula reticaptiva]
MSLKFSNTIDVLASKQVWQYEAVSDRVCPDVVTATYVALQKPDDFPPLQSAIVPGDRVTLAVDPNVPQIAEVIRGVVRAIASTDAGGLDVVVWDEATDETIESIKAEVSPTSRVVRHRSADRRSLGYLAADESADPIYLNRLLVDADFVLPIMAGRPAMVSRPRDLTGVYPWFADSSARARYRDSAPHATKANAKMAAETTWLLGVQIMMCVTPSIDGLASEVIAGTIDAIEKRLHVEASEEPDFPPPAPIVVASLDGDRQQQTWANAARAASAAMDRILPGGTIVLWTDITESPSDALIRRANQDDADEQADELADQHGANSDGSDSNGSDIDNDAKNESQDGDDEFPRWDDSIAISRLFADITAEYRLLIHAAIDDHVIESMGMGSVADGAGLCRLSKSFDGCGVLRAAQFA